MDPRGVLWMHLPQSNFFYFRTVFGKICAKYTGFRLQIVRLLRAPGYNKQASDWSQCLKSSDKMSTT